MPRQLTPEEVKIIRQTEAEGARLYAENARQNTGSARQSEGSARPGADDDEQYSGNSKNGPEGRGTKGRDAEERNADGRGAAPSTLLHTIKGIAIYTAVFVLFVLAAYFVFSRTAK